MVSTPGTPLKVHLYFSHSTIFIYMPNILPGKEWFSQPRPNRACLPTCTPRGKTQLLF
jgi:hypothetical protein